LIVGIVTEDPPDVDLHIFVTNPDDVRVPPDFLGPIQDLEDIFCFRYNFAFPYGHPLSAVPLQ
jgi:hypothetical protein